MLRSAIAAGLALLLCGPVLAASNKYANVHALGLISILGANIELQRLDGTLRVESRDELHPDWKIDDTVFTLVGRALGDRFALKRVAIDPAALMDKGDPIGRSVLRERILALPNRGDLDAYIVVMPTAEGPIEATGLGLTRTAPLWGLIGRPEALAYANYKVVVVDAKTGEDIDYGSSGRPYGTNLQMNKCSADIWADPDAPQTAQELAAFRSVVVKIVTASLPTALASAGLIDKETPIDSTDLDDHAWAGFCDAEPGV